MNATSSTGPPPPLSLTGALLAADATSEVTIVVCKGRIIDIGTGIAPIGRTIDVEGRLVLPGLIDMHIHGAAGHSFENATDQAGIVTILRHLAGRGVTSVVASLASDDVETTASTLQALHRYRDDPPAGAAQVLGVHLEGPFLAPAQAGAHSPEALRTPDRASTDLLASLGPAMVTLAPELPGAHEAVRRFARGGAVVAAGHSEASGSDLRTAQELGLSHLTHLWSGQNGLTRVGPWRVPGLLEESLASSDLTAEVIADGRHLPPTLLEIARRCLPDRLIVVSDATAGAGMPDGWRYRLAEVECEVRDGVGVVVGADAFGGSTTTLDAMLAYLHRELGWPLAEVLPMVTSRPAHVLGRAAAKGTLRVGADADILVTDQDLNPWSTIVRGEEVRPG